MTNEMKIAEIRNAFDKVVDQWDMENLSSPELVQMSLATEKEMASLSN